MNENKIARELLRLAKNIIAKKWINDPNDYYESGKKAGKAMKHQDIGAYDFEMKWLNKAIMLEDKDKQKEAKRLFDEGYQEENPRRKFEPFLSSEKFDDNFVVVKRASDEIQYSDKFKFNEINYLTSGRYDWFNKNLNENQKKSLLNIVFPALIKIHRQITSGNLKNKILVLNLSIRDESIKIDENGNVFLYDNKVKNPTQFLKVHEGDIKKSSVDRSIISELLKVASLLIEAKDTEWLSELKRLLAKENWRQWTSLNLGHVAFMTKDLNKRLDISIDTYSPKNAVITVKLTPKGKKGESETINTMPENIAKEIYDFVTKENVIASEVKKILAT